MTAVNKQSKARQRLAQHMDDRRLDLGLRWTDVAEDSGLTTETLRQVRFGTGEIRGLTMTAIESALGWERGSIRAVLAGGKPTVLTEAQGGEERSPKPDVLTAIDNDPDLLEEAREHLRNQYRLLLRIPDSSDAAGRTQLRPVAHLRPDEKATEADVQEVQRLARQTRERHESERRSSRRTRKPGEKDA